MLYKHCNSYWTNYMYLFSLFWTWQRLKINFSLSNKASMVNFCKNYIMEFIYIDIVNTKTSGFLFVLWPMLGTVVLTFMQKDISNLQIYLIIWTNQTLVQNLVNNTLAIFFAQPIAANIWHRINMSFKVTKHIKLCNFL